MQQYIQMKNQLEVDDHGDGVRGQVEAEPRPSVVPAESLGGGIPAPVQPNGGEDVEEVEEEVCFCGVELNWPNARPIGCPTHVFHAECLIRWALREDRAVANKKTCPLCRTEFEEIIMEEYIGSPEESRRPEDIVREQLLALDGRIPAPVPATWDTWDTIVPVDWPEVPESERDRPALRIINEHQLR